MQHKLKKIKQDIINELERTNTLDQLEDIYNRYFSRNSGRLTQLSKDIKKVATDQKPVVGRLLNQIKKEAEQMFAQAKQDINRHSGHDANEADFFDPTLPALGPKPGNLHILTKMQYEIEDIFRQLGFIVADGPLLESDWYNFEALNIPADHPARDMQDTFYVAETLKHKNTDAQKKPKLVMRTHTSNVQVRAMEKYGVPIRCIAPGRVYRNEATDARHEHTFYQIEGLMVGENISVANLKSVIDNMIKAILGEKFKTRIRPGFFSFVEPGLEVDMSCSLCRGRGCRVCKHTGWVELMGAGMVHPNVLKAAKVNPDKYSGFAFGFGLERLAMIRYNIDDIRLFHSGDLRFLHQL